MEPLPAPQQLPFLMDLISAPVGQARDALSHIVTASSRSSEDPTVLPAAIAASRNVILEVLRLLKGVCDGLHGSEVGSGWDDEDDEDDEGGRDERAGFLDSNANPKRVDGLGEAVKATIENVRGTVWETVSGVFQLFKDDEEVLEVRMSSLFGNFCFFLLFFFKKKLLSFF